MRWQKGMLLKNTLLLRWQKGMFLKNTLLLHEIELLGVPSYKLHTDQKSGDSIILRRRYTCLNHGTVQSPLSTWYLIYWTCFSSMLQFKACVTIQIRLQKALLLSACPYLSEVVLTHVFSVCRLKYICRSPELSVLILAIPEELWLHDVWSTIIHLILFSSDMKSSKTTLLKTWYMIIKSWNHKLTPSGGMSTVSSLLGFLGC